MSHPPYPAYVQTNVPWLGDIPKHWRAQRLKNLFEIVKTIANVDGLAVLSVTQKGIRIKDTESNEGQLSMDYSKYQIVHPGDFAMNHMDLLTGYVDVSAYYGVTSPDYRVFRLWDDRNSSRFFLYLLQNCYHNKLFFPFGQGSSQLGRWRLPTDAFNEFVLPVPPPEEQTYIAAFLDRETAKVDALVEEQKRLIDLLKEKRQAVISHAVTRGLNPDAPMKDSGIQWLGEVPEHWDVGAIKHSCALITDGAHVSPETENGLYPFVSTRDVRDDGIDFEDCLFTSASSYEALVRSGCQPELGDVLFSKDGTIGRTVVVREKRAFVVASSLIIIRPDPKKLLPHFLSYLCQSAPISGQVSSFVKGAGLPRLSIQNLLKIAGIMPPVHEQQEIVEVLDEQLSKLTSLITVAMEAVDLLQERRSSLISAAVTGKIDILGQSTSAVVIPDFRKSRKLVAAKIIEELAGQKTFGRVKLQKLLYLAEAHGGIHELSGHYVREAAGPLDRDMVREVEADLQASDHIFVEQPGGRGTAVSYHLRGPRRAFEAELKQFLGDRSPALSELIQTVGALDTRGAEAVATLYAVWNDAVASGNAPSDDEMIMEVLNDWHPKKAETFTVPDLTHWLAWMRRNGLEPKGRGPVTSTERLFV